ncbi:EEF1B [Lepeophtheirus salmonis]|uniref:EEF1B n=1 Tax=Lepeophtheirus salmonis TaxID=72036 RepID=A0A7R8CW76_LEPSM|nr:EEF1B [Lepeophtheirus salmonis]CAF2950940.1 EEF1B [Lepeophtheirus salmonis]
MRVSGVLYLWPKNMPGGNIFSGKYKLNRQVKPWDLDKAQKDMRREVKNIGLTSNASRCVTPEQEEAYFNSVKGDLRPDQVWFRARKAKLEATLMGPVPLKDHYKQLHRTDSWDSQI